MPTRICRPARASASSAAASPRPTLRLRSSSAARRCKCRCRRKSAPMRQAGGSRSVSSGRSRPQAPMAKRSARTVLTTCAASLERRVVAEAATVDAPYAMLEQLEPGIGRVLAHNPSAFTYYGTQSYVIGTGDVAVIDPGPDIPEHIEALERAIGGRRV